MVAWGSVAKTQAVCFAFGTVGTGHVTHAVKYLFGMVSAVHAVQAEWSAFGTVFPVQKTHFVWLTFDTVLYWHAEQIGEPGFLAIVPGPHA